jgi:hypothetical protein
MSDPQILASASKQLLCCSYGIFEFAKAGGYPPNKIKYIPATFKQLARPSSNSLTNTLQRYNLTNQKYIGCDIESSK